MHRPHFGNENLANGDSFNMVETPEESPERDPKSQREIGGRFNMMAQRHEEVSRSVRNLQMERNASDMMNGEPKVIEIDLADEQRNRGQYEERKRMNRFR